MAENRRRVGAKQGAARRRRPGALTEQVRETIERKIVAGEIAAGQKLNAHALAKAIGVSRSPVREALRALEQAELVQAIPNRGVFVRALELGEVIDLYDIRIGLARQAGRLLAGRITAEQIDALERLYEELEQARTRRDGDAYHRLNLLFHTQLMQYTGNPALAALDERLKKQLRLFLRKGISGLAQLRMSSADHRALLDAIAAGDAEAAAKAYEQHSITGKQRMLDTLGSNGSLDSLALRGPRPAGRRSAPR